MKTVYFAGKVSKGGGYRGKLFNNDRVMSNGYGVMEFDTGKLIYGGPFALSCDHGCFHGPGQHGLVFTKNECYGSLELENWPYKSHDICVGLGREDSVKRCLEQIRNCDAVHCYLDNISAYGSLVELGYASALDKPIYIYFKPNAHNWNKHYWFCMNLPNVKFCGPGDETDIHPDLLTKEKSYKERYYEYLKSPEWDALRKAKLREAGYACQLCNSKDKLNVHHRTYDRVFRELLEDLIALCERCHQKFHDIGA